MWENIKPLQKPLSKLMLIAEAYDESDTFNGAVMHLFKHSKLALTFLQTVPKMCKRLTCWGKELYAQAIRRNPKLDLTVFPCSCFDPDWFLGPHTVGFRLFLNVTETPDYSLQDLYNGSFAYHWHGQWRDTEHPQLGSKWDQIEKAHQHLFTTNFEQLKTAKSKNKSKGIV